MFLVGWSGWTTFPLGEDCPDAGALLVAAGDRDEATALVQQLLERAGYTQITIHKVDRVHNPNVDGILAEVTSSG